MRVGSWVPPRENEPSAGWGPNGTIKSITWFGLVTRGVGPAQQVAENSEVYWENSEWRKWLVISSFICVLDPGSWSVSQGLVEKYKNTKRNVATHRMVGVTYHMQSILKRTKHWNKALATSALSHTHTDALYNERKMEIYYKHQTTEVSG